MSRKVTMQQIADIAGFSKFAVSRALSGKSGVTPETRSIIIETAKQLGYFVQQKRKREPKSNNTSPIPHPKEKKVIAVVIPDTRNQNKDNPYWGGLLEGIVNKIEETDLNMLLITEQLSDHLLNAINSNGLLGYICVGYIPTEIVLEISKQGLPLVLVDHEEPLVPSDNLFINNFDNMRQLTTYLISLGHRHLQFVGNMNLNRSFYDRYCGYRAALEDNQLTLPEHNELLELFVLNPHSWNELVIGQLQKMKTSGAFLTAFVCVNDLTAEMMIRCLQELNLSVPHDCSVSGFDHLETSSFNITTISVDKQALGSRSVEMLKRRYEYPESAYEKVSLFGSMIISHTTAPPPRHGS